MTRHSYKLTTGQQGHYTKWPVAPGVLAIEYTFPDGDPARWSPYFVCSTPDTNLEQAWYAQLPKNHITRSSQHDAITDAIVYAESAADRRHRGVS